MYMGLLLLVLEASAPDHAAAKRDYLARELPYPPLARITRVLDAIDEPGIAEVVLSRYDRFLAGIADATARQRLQLEYEERDEHPEYATLKQSSNALIAALAGAVHGQRGRGRWTDRVFEYLLL
jgi:hypothetical protein